MDSSFFRKRIAEIRDKKNCTRCAFAMMFGDEFWPHGYPNDGEIIRIAFMQYETTLLTIAPSSGEKFFRDMLHTYEGFLFRHMPGGDWHVVYSNGHNVYDPNPMEISSVCGWDKAIQMAMLKVN